jgi:hypothetical protein
MEEEDRAQVWMLYGWFTGLMCVGSVLGAITWGAYMRYLVAEFTVFTPGLTPSQNQLLFAQTQYWGGAFYVTYAMEFLLLSVAKLLVLDRMADFGVVKGAGMSKHLAVGGRVVMAVVIVGNVAGLCANVAAAVYSKKAGDFSMDAAASVGNAYTNFNDQASQQESAADVASSVQQFCEVVVLLIIILAFAVVGIASARRVNSALRGLNDVQGAAVRKLRRQILGTSTLVFVTFMLRCIYAIMNAVSDALQNNGAACAATSGTSCDPSCQNVWDLMQYWLTYTPEFQLMVMVISSPLALVVALWGMTSERTLQRMSHSGRKMTSIGGSQHLRNTS